MDEFENAVKKGKDALKAARDEEEMLRLRQKQTAEHFFKLLKPRFPLDLYNCENAESYHESFDCTGFGFNIRPLEQQKNTNEPAEFKVKASSFGGGYDICRRGYLEKSNVDEQTVLRYAGEFLGKTIDRQEEYKHYLEQDELERSHRYAREIRRKQNEERKSWEDDRRTTQFIVFFLIAVFGLPILILKIFVG